MTALLASTARITIEDGLTMTGTQAPQGLCLMFEGVIGNLQAPYGSVMQSPELGRCDLSGSLPVCKISRVTLAAVTKVLRVVANNQAVTLQSDGWRLLGARRSWRASGGLTAGLRSAALAATLGSAALAITGFKQLRLQGRSAEGLLMHSDFQSCSAVTVGQICK
jgi:hypothetical protein